MNPPVLDPWHFNLTSPDTAETFSMKSQESAVLRLAREVARQISMALHRLLRLAEREAGRVRARSFGLFAAERHWWLLSPCTASFAKDEKQLGSAETCDLQVMVLMNQESYQ